MDGRGMATDRVVCLLRPAVSKFVLDDPSGRSIDLFTLVSLSYDLLFSTHFISHYKNSTTKSWFHISDRQKKAEASTSLRRILFHLEPTGVISRFQLIGCGNPNKRMHASCERTCLGSRVSGGRTRKQIDFNWKFHKRVSAILIDFLKRTISSFWFKSHRNGSIFLVSFLGKNSLLPTRIPPALQNLFTLNENVDSNLFTRYQTTYHDSLRKKAQNMRRHELQLPAWKSLQQLLVRDRSLPSRRTEITDAKIEVDWSMDYNNTSPYWILRESWRRPRDGGCRFRSL